jgi:hypothetical protein
VRWSDQQTSRWGSCTIDTGAIRLSSRMREFPAWVVDYVLVHELAHLRYRSHGPRFWSLVARYPLAERARGYLIAKGGDADRGRVCPEGDPPTTGHSVSLADRQLEAHGRGRTVVGH